jgi:biopolymer transport protein ExbD
MIDVMFFLLVTFMLAALSMKHIDSLGINLPRGSASRVEAERPVTLAITQEGQILVNQIPVTLNTLASVLQPMLEGQDHSVIVAADTKVAQGIVVQAMLNARQAGAEHFLIAVENQ